MTVKEQAQAWAEKYNQPEDITTRALARAEICDSCEHNVLIGDETIQVNKCNLCGCKLIRTAFNEVSNPCPLYKFDEPLPAYLQPSSNL